MTDVPKVCSNCEFAIRKPVWLFFNRWYCRNSTVRSVFNPIVGNSVECHLARHSSKSPCGPTANCYDGPADFKPDPSKPMSYQSSYSMTMRVPENHMSFQLPASNRAWPAYSRPIGNTIVNNLSRPPSTHVYDNGGGGGFLAGAALGYMLGHNNDSPSTPAAEPWSGGGGEMSGGGASDSWDSGSDGGSSDSGGDSGSND